MSAIDGISTAVHHQVLKKVVAPIEPDPIAAMVPAAAIGGFSSGTTQTSTGHGGDNDTERMNEAFAKMKVALQNPTDVNSDGQANKGSSSLAGSAPNESKSATQEFMDYMKLTPREKLRVGMMAEIGVTQQQYNAMSSEDKAKVDRKIAELEKQKQDSKLAEKASAISTNGV